MGNYNNVTYNRDTDYRKRIDDAAAKGDYVLAGMLEQQRNAKIDGEKRTESKTYDYSRYLEPGADVGFKTSPSAGSETGITADDVDDYEGNGGRGYSYDASKDKTYQNLVKQVQKNAEFVGDNTLGRFSAMTGGIPSSYAVSAAANAQADVLDDINDIYAEREGEAYNRYMAKDQIDYSRYLDKADREAARAAAEEETRRWNRENWLKERQTEADIGYTEAKTAEQEKANEYADDLYKAEYAGMLADNELTKAKTTAQETENDYAARLSEAELARIYADTDLTKAKLTGQELDNLYAPLGYLDGLTGEGDTSTEEMTVADILNKANGGGYLTDAEYAMLDRAKENILAKVGAPGYTGTLTDEEMNILRAFGYTSGQLAKGIGYDSQSGAFTAPEGTANAKNVAGLISELEEQWGDSYNNALKNSDTFADFLTFVGINDIATQEMLYDYYSKKLGW